MPPATRRAGLGGKMPPAKNPAGRAAGGGDALDQPAEVRRRQLLAAEPPRHQGAEDAGLLQEIDDVAAEAPLPGEFHAPGAGFLEKPLQRLLIDHDDLSPGRTAVIWGSAPRRRPRGILVAGPRRFLIARPGATAVRAWRGLGLVRSWCRGWRGWRRQVADATARAGLRQGWRGDGKSKDSEGCDLHGELLGL